MQVLDHGEVELVSASASDLSVVAAARVSHGVDYAAASKGEKSDAKLIGYLLKHNHGTPFEHNLLTFYVKAPLFVVREWHRHRVGWSYNEVSGRYTEMEEDYYVPSEIRIPTPSNRQGSVVAPWAPNKHAIVEDFIRTHSEFAFQEYRTLLDNGVAREMARIILPLNTYTRFYATCNARSLMHFLRLRQAEDAQWEIRQYANALADIFAQQMPITASAFQQMSATGPSSAGAAPDPSDTVALTTSSSLASST